MILNMSLMASLLIVVIVLIRLLAMNKLPKKTFLILWFVVACRLMIPFSVPSHLSVYNALSYVADLPEEADVVDAILMNKTGLAPSLLPHEGAIQVEESLTSFSPLMAIWITGAIGLAAFFLVTHLRWRREYRTALPVHDRFLTQWLKEHPTRRRIRLRQSDQIISPLTYGIWRPVILLPKTMDYTDTSQLAYVLAHEFVHIKRYDTMTKWLLVAALCLHWFNPLVWVMYVLANRDIELSCDETVVREFGESQKSAYALTLIRMAETQSRWTTSFSNFSKNSLEERIKAIMKIKKSNIMGVILALALVTGTTVAFATSAVETRSLGPFEHVFEAEGDKYASHINDLSGEGTLAKTKEYSLSVDSTLFTDHNAYAILGVEGDLSKDLVIEGRIVNANNDQTLYGLAGTIKEIEPKHGIRYFLYSATLAEPGPPQQPNRQLVLAAGDQFLKWNSLRDHEGNLLELSATLEGRVVTLRTAVANVSTEALIFHPDASRYDGAYFETVILTPSMIKMAGQGNNLAGRAEDLPMIMLKIVLADGSEINMSYDTRGTVADEGHRLALSRGQNDDTGEFYHHWDFRGWELNLTQVSALVVDGVTYRVNR